MAFIIDFSSDDETQQEILKQLGSMIIDSRQFKDLKFGQVKSEVIYSSDEYLTLLNTYSPYLKLEPQKKELLFAGLKQRIDNDFGGQLKLSYISAFHIAQKN
ncbi:hypothetical protein H6G97_36645 [Nostoc flagelliforme FACHB-838]|uniref:Uncharacterized protein n=1 Tax=Nostoc flagelliforme FACHB-838 TaxID=2692904 RepID=A0ABR8E2C3_9NOSO|nr:hypothetical protein [Nostoc flagelliforme]MBD2534705.1 hypothetical protein [Nostoc flagelliforme FACHB-838]